MFFYFFRVIGRLIGLYDSLKGEKTLILLQVNADPNEVYHISTNNGGCISIYCVETIYEIKYSAWWALNKKHHSYKVYGICDEKIPSEFSSRIGGGFHIGRLLPQYSLRSDQKKAAIHAYVSMIVEQLKNK